MSRSQVIRRSPNHEVRSGSGGGDPQQPAPEKLSKACLQALAKAGQTSDAVRRGLAASGSIVQAAADNEIDPNILAAIGVRESGFRDINERGGGGRGVFQIDVRSFPNADSFAHDIDRAADFAASLIQQRTDVYQRRGFSDELSIAGAIRDYNHGPRGTLDLLRRGDVPSLDRGTARGNYVTNVLAIARNCFHF